MKYILAHDLGTSGNKATLFSDEGKMITSEVFRYDCHYFNTNWAEQDPEDFWKAICVTSRNLIDKARIDPGDIAAVSFSGQMMGCLCVDKQGNPLRPSIIWADQRAQAQAAALGDGLPVRRPGGSRYAYLAWEEDAGVLDALEALSARQKEALWRGFLQDGTQPMEFQWLWDAYREGAVDSLLEWELTLQLTLEALGFAVVNGAGRFTVTGPDGSARSFDLIRGGPAEKLFLKILFPLDKRE